MMAFPNGCRLIYINNWKVAHIFNAINCRLIHNINVYILIFHNMFWIERLHHIRTWINNVPNVGTPLASYLVLSQSLSVVTGASLKTRLHEQLVGQLVVCVNGPNNRMRRITFGVRRWIRGIGGHVSYSSRLVPGLSCSQRRCWRN